MGLYGFADKETALKLKGIAQRFPFASRQTEGGPPQFGDRPMVYLVNPKTDITAAELVTETDSDGFSNKRIKVGTGTAVVHEYDNLQDADDTPAADQPRTTKPRRPSADYNPAIKLNPPLEVTVYNFTMQTFPENGGADIDTASGVLLCVEDTFGRLWAIPPASDCNFYGIPPENSTGFLAGAVFQARMTLEEMQQRMFDLYVPGTLPSGNYNPVSVWVTQAEVPAGSRAPVVIKPINDPTSVFIRRGSLIGEWVQFNSDNGPPYRYSLKDGQTWMELGVDKPVWVCYSNGKLQYERYAIFKVHVEDVIKHSSGVRIAKVSIPWYTSYLYIAETTYDHTYRALNVPDIRPRDVITVQVDMENLPTDIGNISTSADVTRFSGNIILDCACDEPDGNLRITDSLTSPGRGWSIDHTLRMKNYNDQLQELYVWKKTRPS